MAGGIIGGLGGILGAALLTKSVQTGGASLLGSLLKSAAGAAVSGGKGGGQSSGQGKGGGKDLAGTAVETLLSAVADGGGQGKGSGSGKGSGGSRGSGKGAGSRGGQGKGRGKGGDAEPSLSTLLEKTLESLENSSSRRAELAGKQPKLAQNDVIDLPADAVSLRAVEPDPVEVAPAVNEVVSGIAEERRAEALRLLDAATVSAVPGRVRLRHPAFKEPAVQTLRNGLLAVGMADAVFNAGTGSILLTYDSASLSPEDFLEALLPLGEFLLEHEH